MGKPTSSPPEKWISDRSDKTVDAGERKLNGSFKEKSMTIPDQNKEQILRLIAEGEDLAECKDLHRFYDWIDKSYEALEVHPIQQPLFNEFCRASDEPNFIVKTMLGVWLLRLALR